MIVESPLKPEQASFRQVIPAGDYFLKVIQAGETLRILDLEGNQAADTLFYKVIEEAPAPGLDDTVGERMHATAQRLGEAITYRSAGTVEFIYAPDSQAFWRTLNDPFPAWD